MENASHCRKLFQPGHIGPLRLRNRIVQLPAGGNFVGTSSEVTERTIACYEESAKGGVGLIIVGGVRVLPMERPIDRHFLNLGEKQLLPGHYYLVERVHSHGAKIAVQLNHPGSQVFQADWGGEQPLSPSGIQQFNVKGHPYGTPRPMRRREVYEMIDAFVAAIENAKRAEYDMVEIHAGHGHLIGAFISPATNKRHDEFGGNLANRMRFVTEIIQRTRKQVGREFPIGVRISADEFLPGGITIQDSPEIARMLEKAGAHCINITCGTYLNQHKVSDVMRMDEGWKRPMWKAITQAVDIPTIAGGGNRNPEFCERLISEGDAAFVGLARQMQADPCWPQKTAQGRIRDINRCTSCLRCLYGLDGKPPVVRQCMVNAMWGREKDFVGSFRPSSKKNVMVIGGGPAGMEAARIASLRGHQVSLYEKGPELGGQLLLAAVPPGKSKMLWLRDFLAAQIEKQGVTIRLNTTVDPDSLCKLDPHVVVVATGATPFVPDIPGIKRKHCVTAWDVLAGTSQLSGIHVVVLGGGTVGCETAEYLAKRGKRVTIIEMLPELAHEMEPLNRRALLDELETLKVAALVGKKAVEITKSGMVILDAAGGEQQPLACEHVVLALGAVPDQDLFQTLEGACHERFMIGDCTQPRTALEAVREGFLVGHCI